MDKDIYDYLVGQTNKDVEEKRRDMQHELEQKLFQDKVRLRGTRQEKQDAVKNITHNFWVSKQPELDKFKAHLEKERFQDYGGSHDAAKEQMLAQQKQEQEQQGLAQEKERRTQAIQQQMQNQQQAQQQKQNQDYQNQILARMDEKKKQDQEQQIQDQNQQQQQVVDLEKEKEKRVEYMRNQFNAQSRGQGRGE